MIGRILCFAFAVATLPWLPAAQAQDHPAFDHENFAKQEFERLVRLSELRSAEERKMGLAHQGTFDVVHYDLSLDIDVSGRSITGSVSLGAVVTAPTISEVVLDLYDNLVVAGVRHGVTDLAYTHQGNLLTIELDGDYASADTIRVTVDYSGMPGVLNDVFGVDVFAFGTHPEGGTAPVVQTFSEPFFARAWWPCKDVPDDKATVDLHVTVPDTLVVASNGVLVGRVDVGAQRARYDWSERYPIATYLVSLEISNYEVFSDYFVYGPSDSMRVDFYVFAEDLADAQVDFGVTVPMLEFFSSIFGLYPFVEEKYAVAEFNFIGAMEHQTCTSYGRPFITGDNRFDWISAHELSHHWWGDLVSPADWRDVWLNEGFASYAEALWLEHVGGVEAYQNVLHSKRYTSIGTKRVFSGTLYDPPRLFDSTNVYNRGAWVLHMLRHVMGDSLFFRSLADYAADGRFAYGNATTRDFQGVCESNYGDLAWFFDQWVFSWNDCDPGTICDPVEYEYAWAPTAGESPAIDLTIWQTQAGSLIRMPIDVHVTTVAGDTTFVVWNSQAMEEYTLATPGMALRADLDPDEWIVRSVSARGTPEIPLLSVYPNPVRTSATLVLGTDIGGTVTIDVYDASGARIRRLFDGTLAGRREIAWDGKNDVGRRVASGVYFVRLRAPGLGRFHKVVVVR